MNLKLIQLIFIGLFAFSTAFGQSRPITGIVTGADDGRPLPGVSVKVKGSTLATSTDLNGAYKIEVPNSNSILVFAYLGYSTKEVSTQGRTIISLSLNASSTELNELVVTGYQSKIKSSLSSSVSQVEGKELANKPVPSIDNLLQGQAAGVQVTAQTGEPGGNAYIRIRGVGSVTTGQDPLLVVDGIQIPDNEAGQFYTTLNANDIASINILKDAAASAVYGARGSNGVVLITTKSGKESAGQITYSFQYGSNKKIKDNFTLMTTAQKLQYEYDLGYTNGTAQNYFAANNFPANATITNITAAQRQATWASLEAQSHDWSKDILRTGFIRQHQLAFSGHDTKTSYYASFQYYNEDGITEGSNFIRYAGKVNISTQIKPWLSLTNNLSIGERSSNILRNRYNVQNPFYAIYAYNGYEPVFNSDGTYNLTNQGFPILEAIKNNPEIQKYTTGYNSSTLDFHPIKGLSISTQMGITYNGYVRSYFIKPGSVLDGYVGDPANPGIKTDNGSTEFGYDWINKGIYKFDIATNHHFSVLAVQEFQKDQFTSYAESSKGFVNSNLSTQDNAAKVSGLNSTTASNYTLSSLLGELDYNYKEKYYVTGSIRRDGSSRFGANNQYGNFYSGSLGWVLTQESFLKSLEWINILKLRGSIGNVGNFSPIGNYQSLGLYAYGNYNGSSASVPTQIANPNLSWEKKLKRDIGVDFELFHSRLSGTIEYYNENTTALLLNVPISQTVGFSSITKNAGALNNKGFDINLSGDLIRYNGFKWTLFGNINFNKNTIINLYDGATEIDDANGYSADKPGEAINTFKLVRYAGVNAQTGAPQFLDKNGVVTENYSSGDAVLLHGKSPNPKEFGGFGTSFGYKGIELSANFTYIVGNYVYNNEYHDLNAWGDNVNQNQAVGALNYWKKPGDVNVLPAASTANTTYQTDLYLQNDTYIRLRNLTLSYTIPKSISQKYHVQSLRIFGSGQNLWTINPHHFFSDPEVGNSSGGTAEGNPPNINGLSTGYSYPATRQFTFGLNLTF